MGNQYNDNGGETFYDPPKSSHLRNQHPVITEWEVAELAGKYREQMGHFLEGRKRALNPTAEDLNAVVR